VCGVCYTDRIRSRRSQRLFSRAQRKISRTFRHKLNLKRMILRPTAAAPGVTTALRNRNAAKEFRRGTRGRTQVPPI
jgi:hypothetical protein